MSLTSRIVAAGQRAPDSVIVGRADCGETVWLLNEAHQLVRIAVVQRAVSINQLHGLRGADRPWGLACAADGSLWTLADPRVLARIDREGRIAERIPLEVPRIALFAVAGRLLFQPVPPVVATPALATSPPRQPLDVRPWPGLLARAGADRASELTDNLASCGLARGPTIPCWLPGDTHVSLSDGVRAERRTFPSLNSPGIEPKAPIRDVAFATTSRVWLLATARQRHRGRLAGARLALTGADGREMARLELAPPARLMLSASEVSCLLLTSDGEVQEVRAR